MENAVVWEKVALLIPSPYVGTNAECSLLSYIGDML